MYMNNFDNYCAVFSVVTGVTKVNV